MWTPATLWKLSSSDGAVGFPYEAPLCINKWTDGCGLSNSPWTVTRVSIFRSSSDHVGADEIPLKFAPVAGVPKMPGWKGQRLFPFITVRELPLYGSFHAPFVGKECVLTADSEWNANCIRGALPWCRNRGCDSNSSCRKKNTDSNIARKRVRWIWV